MSPPSRLGHFAEASGRLAAHDQGPAKPDHQVRKRGIVQFGGSAGAERGPENRKVCGRADCRAGARRGSDTDRQQEAVSGGLPPGIPPPNIIHDTDINQTVNELKAAGAEAISVNDQRVGRGDPNPLRRADGFCQQHALRPRPMSSRPSAIRQTLETALNIPGGEADQMKDFDKAMFSVQPMKRLVIPGL